MSLTKLTDVTDTGMHTQWSDLYNPGVAAIVPNLDPGNYSAAFLGLGLFRTYGARGAVIRFALPQAGTPRFMHWYLAYGATQTPEVLKVADNGVYLQEVAAGLSTFRRVDLSGANAQIDVAINFPAWSNDEDVYIMLRREAGWAGAINMCVLQVALSDEPLDISTFNTAVQAVQVGGTALADLDALATYLPGMAGDFMPPTAGLVAATPTLLGVASGLYYAVQVDPLAGGPAAVRVLTSRPIAIAGAGLVSCTFTNGNPTVTLTGTVVGNVAIGQFVYLAADGAAFAGRVTNVVVGGGNTTITLAANYTGAGGVGAGRVCGLAIATYPSVPPLSDGASPVVYGPFVAGDVIIVYADAAYAGAVVGAARSVL